jgi:hypothetical protein
LLFDLRFSNRDKSSQLSGATHVRVQNSHCLLRSHEVKSMTLGPRKDRRSVGLMVRKMCSSLVRRIYNVAPQARNIAGGEEGEEAHHNPAAPFSEPAKHPLHVLAAANSDAPLSARTKTMTDAAYQPLR